MDITEILKSLFARIMLMDEREVAEFAELVRQLKNQLPAQQLCESEVDV
ncbi:MAG: hypothetical protein FWC13_07565 [Oscillospiraceae bacterium]|nr:hypothetical protein [Oscillospiraceae bacterium]